MTHLDDDGDSASVEQSGSTLNVLLPEWVLQLRILAPVAGTLFAIVTSARARTVFILVALTGLSATTINELLTKGKSPAAIIIDDYLFETVLKPLGIAIFVGGLNAINELILLLFGTDRAVGIAPGSRPGAVDVPFVLVEPAIQGFLNIGLVVFNTVNVFNQSLAQDLEGVGLAAPLLVNFIWAMELTVIGAAVWFMISFIPVFNVRGIILALTALPRRAFRRLL